MVRSVTAPPSSQARSSTCSRCEHPPRRPGQERQQPELLAREGQRHTFPMRLELFLVDCQRAVAPQGFRRGRPWREPSPPRLDAGDQFARTEGFRHVVITADFQPDDAVDLIPLRGQEQDGQFTRDMPDLTTDLETIDVGQPHVQDQKVGRGRAHAERHGLRSPRGMAHPVTLGAQGVVEDVHDVRVILGDQDMEGRLHGDRPGLGNLLFVPSTRPRPQKNLAVSGPAIVYSVQRWINKRPKLPNPRPMKLSVRCLILGLACVAALCSSATAATVTLRVVEYNIAADVDGYTAARPGLDTVLEAIGQQNVNGIIRPPDVIALEGNHQQRHNRRPARQHAQHVLRRDGLRREPLSGDRGGRQPRHRQRSQRGALQHADPCSGRQRRGGHAAGCDQRRIPADRALRIRAGRRHRGQRVLRLRQPHEEQHQRHFDDRAGGPGPPRRKCCAPTPPRSPPPQACSTWAITISKAAPKPPTRP